jgi:gamma-glutamyl AIG2-like cyclotransferase
MPLLFSYGTLQQGDVQMALFGRLLRGQPDELVGFDRASIEVDDPDLVTSGGKATHAIVRWSGDEKSRVGGVALEVTDEDLARADRYEPSPYERIETVLASGRRAWVYADGRDA